MSAFQTTRSYAYAAGERLAVGSSSVKTAAAINAEEVLLHASTRCFVRIGDSTVAATVGAGSIPLEQGEKFHLRLTRGQYVAVIRDTADGYLAVIPVAA